MKNKQQHNIPSNGMPDEQLLLKYLQGKLSPEEQHAVESMMNDSDFEQDALDGLEQFEQQQLPVYVQEINSHLEKKLKQKPGRRKRRPLPSMAWIYLTLFIILSLLILSYIIIHFSR